MPPQPKNHPCPQCSAPIPGEGGSGGLCPRCLFELGLGRDPDLDVVISGPGGAPPPPPAPEEIQPFFPQLEVLEVVGEGGMGVVYRARQRGLDREVALKILGDRVASVPAFAERFEREARALARLDHPNIVRVHDSGRAGGLYYLVMEYVDGATLREVIRARSAGPAEALRLVGGVCEALQYAHDNGVVHRDVKPENILIDRDGRPRIADFGLVKLAETEGGSRGLTATGQAMGTPHYMAPEQIERPLEVDHRADIYSLGVVFYELLTGELPLGRFVEPSRKVDVDVRLDEVVLRTLEKEPERRYQRASDLRSDVEDASRGRRPSGARPAAGRPDGAGVVFEVEVGGIPRRRMRWRVYSIGLLAGAIALAAFTPGVLFQHGPGSSWVPSRSAGWLPGYLPAQLVCTGLLIGLAAVARQAFRRRPGSVGAGLLTRLPIAVAMMAVPVLLTQAFFLDWLSNPLYLPGPGPGGEIVLARIFAASTLLWNLVFLGTAWWACGGSAAEPAPAAPRAAGPVVYVVLGGIGIVGSLLLEEFVHRGSLTEHLQQLLWTSIGTVVAIIAVRSRRRTSPPLRRFLSIAIPLCGAGLAGSLVLEEHVWSGSFSDHLQQLLWLVVGCAVAFFAIGWRQAAKAARRRTLRWLLSSARSGVWAAWCSRSTCTAGARPSACSRSCGW